ncbi:type IV secretory system conjugative DNA transfer family protein [Cognatiluteimonas telluris]|uniref:type IV secretory system conjugative DNA transfer family protein n=1 Tax=Cognatiluteimonas telluris TaxID=1104775 RepID=UPI001FAFF30C|nr:type IV secretory system conjugative DNA transfer family protein [Lysobacter telluris]
MPHRKSLLTAFAIALALVAGLYLSGYLALRLLGLPAGLLHWHTYIDYLRALPLPRLQPYARRIWIAGGIGFGIVLAIAIALLVGLLRPARKSLHGDARFASRRDLARRGLLKPAHDGIIVGQYRGRLLRLSGQQSVVLAAPTRSGKGVGIVVPNLLAYRESMVVLDIKQENFALTSGWRARQGHAVYLFNPFADDGRSHRWNPLRYVADDPARRVGDLMAIAAMLYPDAGDEQKFWVSQARNAFLAFALFLFENREDEARLGFPVQVPAPSLGGVFRLATGDGQRMAREHIQWLGGREFLGDSARSAFANLLSQADDTFASILGSFREPLNAWINPVLDAATSGDDFLLTDLRRRRMTIYVGIAPNRLAESRVLVNLFFSQLINLNTRTLPQDDPSLKHQCLLLMDEFTAIGKVEILASAIAFLAGYNLRLLPVIQSMAQLDATYGKDVARTILTNHALQVIFAPREQRDANDYSEMLGYTTVRRRTITRGREVSRSEVLERRALLLPQELKALGADRQVLLCEGLAHPALCDKLRYYSDRRFRRRLLPRTAVPDLS